MPEEADGSDLIGSTDSDIWTLNGLPYGRKYSKEIQSDGSVVWTARRAMNSEPVVTVTVKPVPNVHGDDYAGVFDPNTLGRWALVPECYRTYWSFDEEYCQLSYSPDVRISSRVLHDRIESYLCDNDMPAQVRRALDYLRFKAAVMTDDADCVRRSAQVCVDGLCRDKSVDAYECLMELAGIAGKIEEQYPQQAAEWLRPLVRQMVEHTGRDAVGNLDRLMPSIDANKWFTYAKLVLEEVQNQGLADEETFNAMTARLEAARIARTLFPPDPCEPSASVKYYMVHLDDDPPKGTLDLNDAHEILEKGLAKAYAERDSEMKCRVVEDVLRSIRLIVGEGPFCGDEAKLIESIERFSEVYLVVRRATEPIDTVLATFLALSFGDISTPEDHDMLLSRFRECRTDLQSQVNDMLSQRGLNSLVIREDVQGVFDRYERIFRKYVDDPLWPAFKFPWTSDEEARLVAKLKLRFIQLKIPLDAISLKVNHAGESSELKERTLYEISRAAQSLLTQAAFLRTPPYPGISGQYRSGYGFSVVIKGPLYHEGYNTPQNLDHRLGWIRCLNGKCIQETNDGEQA